LKSCLNELVGMTLGLRVSLAAGLMFPACWRAIRVIDKNIVVTRGTDNAVNRLAELFVARLGCVLAAGLFSAHCHPNGSFLTMVSMQENS
jgi:hypothetical protein